ncbi:MAG: hypothetical protein LKE30_05480 [Bacteroidales bacterium]|jgi:lipopolysaccharide export system protein LptA|nr:hypothetical protein [Bacteroidales bacterium]
MIKKSFIIIVILFLITPLVYSQKSIQYRSDVGKINPENPNDITLIGHVEFKHNGLIMYCDSAIYNKKDNYFIAFNHINIYDNDTIHLSGDLLNYDGKTRIAELSGEKVILEDGKVTMQTNYLVLDRVVNVVRYVSGANIWDNKNTLKSTEGIYFVDDKVFNFLYNVEITSPKANINSDSLIYNTKTEKATFIGPTVINAKDSTIIKTTQGDYNTKTDEVYSEKNAEIYTKDQYITSDTLYYNKKKKIGYAYGNVFVKDTTNNIILNCDKATLDKIDTLSYSILTGKILCRQIDNQDTLYFHSDTIVVNMDTSFKAKTLIAYNHCKFFRNDFQGAAEWMKYNVEDSILTMIKRPILWSEESQITSDTIVMYTTKKGGIKKLFMYPNALIVQNSDTTTSEYFNQIFGKHLVGYFEKNKIYFAEIEGNSQSIYYVWDEKKNRKKTLTGVNIGRSQKTRLYFKKGKVKSMSAINNPEYYIDDDTKVSQTDKRLKGFIWEIKEKPLKPIDVFVERK